MRSGTSSLTAALINPTERPITRAERPKIRKPPIRSFEKHSGDDLPDGFLDDEEENERSGDATRTDGGIVCHESTPAEDADLPRTNAGTPLPELRFVDRFENGDDVFYAVTEENGVRLYRVTGEMTIVRGLLAHDAVIYRGTGSPSITTASYDERYETIDLYHHMAGREASFRADRILDEPVITLAEVNRV